MKLLNLTHQLGALARSSAVLATLVAVITVSACGGGGDGGSNSASATDSFSQGAITGFGSIIVNGVRFDDSSAKVSDDDDDDSPSRSRDDLRLGMVVSVSGASGTATGTASTIVFGSELKGPVQSVGSNTATSTQTLIILGQTVVVGTRTVFDPQSLPNGFSSIAKNDVLEVHGHLDAAANRLVATRINRESSTSNYKITGNINSLNSASQSFKIGAENISYAGIDPGKLRVNLVNGITVKVRLSTVQATTGTWSATRIKPARKSMEDRSKAEIEGLISDFVSATKFSVSGIPVDATNASFPKGTTTLANGVRVEVHGQIVGGTLIATSVKIDSNDDTDNEIELHGSLSSLNVGSKTFVLRGLTVNFSGPVSFERGTVSDLLNGANVEVKGVSASGGTTVQAKKIKFEN